MHPRLPLRHRFLFLIRLLNWEYWPAKIANLPVIAFWLYFSAKARHLFFFSAANPAIETGGILGESKINILNQLPAELKPRTLFLAAGTPPESVLQAMKNQNLSFPVILKPNVGERGRGVEKISDQQALEAYLRLRQVDLLVQAFVEGPEEFSVLYHRFPGEQTGRISSLCHKVPLHVVGDGNRTVEALVMDSPRARFQWKAHSSEWPLNRVPLAGETVLLCPIGNHARGAKFLNANEHIDEQLVRVFDKISQGLHGIYVARFDLKAGSLESLKAGEGISIVEINGVGGEPAHIYDPGYPVRMAYRDLFQHWRTIYEVALEANRLGVSYMSWPEAVARFRAYLQHIRHFT